MTSFVHGQLEIEIPEDFQLPENCPKCGVDLGKNHDISCDFMNDPDIIYGEESGENREHLIKSILLTQHIVKHRPKLGMLFDLPK
ncbi:MAG: hypothetical protein ABIE68_00870 [bacterium]